MSEQLHHWKGDFGVQYARRNNIDPATRVDTLRRLIPADVNDVLEVGPNRGHNMLAMRAAGIPIVCGVEPADYARSIAQSRGLQVVAGDVYAIPYETDGFALVFHSGLAIHLPPERLDDALRELHRVSARYLLAIEYFAEQDTEVEYRGLSNMLWKRDYGAHYLRLFPDLTLRDSGDLTAADGFDEARYWLLEKPS